MLQPYIGSKYKREECNLVTYYIVLFILGSFRYDFVEVEEASETSSVVRGRWCGHREAPPRLTSKTNQIKITFKSDDHFVAKPGFKVCYSLVVSFCFQLLHTMACCIMWGFNLKP